MNNKKRNIKRVDFSDPREKIKGTIFLTLSVIIEFAGIYFAIFQYSWIGLIVALIAPATIFLAVKYTLTVYKRGVQITGDYLIFEPEYKVTVKIHKNDIKSVFVSDPGKGKLPDPEHSYKNKYIVFQMKDGKRNNYPLSLVTKKMLDDIRADISRI